MASWLDDYWCRNEIKTKKGVLNEKRDLFTTTGCFFTTGENAINDEKRVIGKQEQFEKFSQKGGESPPVNTNLGAKDINRWLPF